MLNKVLIIAAAFFTILILLAACRTKFNHCWAHGDPEKRAEWITKKITSELDLDNAQKIILNRIKDEILAKNRELQTTSKQEDYINKIYGELKKDTLDRQILIEFTEEKMQHIEELRAFVIDKCIEFHSVLKPPQKEKLVKKITEYHKQFYK
jgi:protein CpxP